MSFPRRGEIYWVALDPTVSTEIAKTRPALVISNDSGNQHADRVIIAPITTQRQPRLYRFEVSLSVGEGGVTVPSKILLDQMRTVDKSRLGRFVGRLAAQRMLDVDQAIRVSLAV